MSERLSRSRSTVGALCSAALREGRLEFPYCAACGRVQYPPSDICRMCLSDNIKFRQYSQRAQVIASVLVHRSLADDFERGGPWAIASMKMEAGPIAFAHLLEVLPGGTEVTLVALRDRLGDGVLGALTDGQDLQELQARFLMSNE